MKIKIEYTDKAIKELTKITRSDSQKIVKKIKFYITQKDSLEYAKKLKSPVGDLFRFRIGKYRAIFQFDFDSEGNITIFTILDVRHRKDIYKGL
jgi:mRNA-degrading endonuclease RelE of RelBE toxin-antitoxin system